MKKNLASLTAAMIGLIESTKCCDRKNKNNQDVMKNAKLQAELLWQIPVRRMPLHIWLYGYIVLSHPFFMKLHMLIFTFALHAMEGVWIRKMYMEKQVRNFLEKHRNEDVQVLILAAGYDTLAWRLAGEYPHAKFIEFDHPATGQAKLEALKGVIANRKLTKGAGKFGNSISAYQSTKLPNNLYFCRAEVGNSSTISLKDAIQNFVFSADDCDHIHRDGFVSSHQTSDKERFNVLKISTAVVVEGLMTYLTKEENMLMIQQLEELFGCNGSIMSVTYNNFDSSKRSNKISNKSNSFFGIWLKHTLSRFREPFKFGTPPKYFAKVFEGTKWSLVMAKKTWEEENAITAVHSVKMGMTFAATAEWKE